MSAAPSRSLSSKIREEACPEYISYADLLTLAGEGVLTEQQTISFRCALHVMIEEQGKQRTQSSVQSQYNVQAELMVHAIIS